MVRVPSSNTWSIHIAYVDDEGNNQEITIMGIGHIYTTREKNLIDSVFEKPRELVFEGHFCAWQCESFFFLFVGFYLLKIEVGCNL
jgi:hypothetical protein